MSSLKQCASYTIRDGEIVDLVVNMKKETESPLDFIAGRLMNKLHQKHLVYAKLVAHPSTIVELVRSCAPYVVPIPGTDRCRVSKSVTLYPCESVAFGKINRICKYLESTGD